MNTKQTLDLALAAIRAADNQIFRIGGHGALSAQLAQARDAMKALVTKQSATYTVLLLRPDYLNDELDTYFTYAEGNSPQAAVDAARLEAANADGIKEANLTDYTVLLVIEGEHEALNCFTD